MGIEAAIAAAIASAGASAATAAAIASFAVNSVVSLAIGAVTKALSGKPKTPNLDGAFAAKASNITQNIRQPIVERRTLYGEARIGSSVTFIENSSNDKYTHLVYTLVDHEVDEIGEVWFDDKSIPPDYLDSNGNVIKGEFANRARIQKFLGAAGQVAPADLVAETSADSTFMGNGVAYLYIRIEGDRDVYPSGIPVITAFVRGKKVFDPRDGGVKYSANPALFANDYLQEPVDSLTPGLGVDTIFIDQDEFISSANVCEEIVQTQSISASVQAINTGINSIELEGDTLVYQNGDCVRLSSSGVLPSGLATLTDYYVIPYQRKGKPRIKLAISLDDAIAGVEVPIADIGSGSHTVIKTGEPRYFGGGVVDTSEEPTSVLDDIASAMAGYIKDMGGSWKIAAGYYRAPTVELTEDDVLSPLTIVTKAGRRDRFNLVKGIYVSPINDGEPSDYPPVTNSMYVVQDNGKTLPTDLDLPMTPRPHTAQRLAKIKLEKRRQEQIIEGDFGLKALRLRPGNVMSFTFAGLGYATKPFEVQRLDLANKTIEGVVFFYVKLVLQETAPTVYDWNNGEETRVDPAPNTALPDGRTVEVVSGFTLDSLIVSTRESDRIFNVLATWDLHDNQYVVTDGHYEIGFRETGQSVFKSVGRVNGDVTEMVITALKPDTNYDIQIIATNNLGVRSLPTLLEGFLVGTTITSNSEDWENETLSRDGDDWEVETLGSEDWEA